MAKTHYFIACHVSPFVRRYLEINFGYVGNARNNFDIRSDITLYTYFRNMVTRQPLHTNDRGLAHKWRTELVNFEISEFYAEHLGRTLTITEENMLANYLEARCKNILRIYMLSLATIVSNEAECIRLFYKITGWNEDTWPSKSIRKILERDRINQHEKFKPVVAIRNVFERVAEICTSTLRDQNNITQLGKAAYEYNTNNI